MADVPTLSPELCRNVSTLARTLVAAARSWALYPPDHPAVRGSLERVRQAAGGRPFSFGVTPHTLLIAGMPLTGRDPVTVGEAAPWLHDRDVVEIKSIMTRKDSPAFNTQLLRRFINLIGLFPVGTLVRLNTEQTGVVAHAHLTDPFRPQVKIVADRDGAAIEAPALVNTWEPDGRGDCAWTVVEAVDPDTAALDPLTYLREL